jgi:hypothetical protein
MHTASQTTKHLIFWGSLAFLFVGYPLLAHNYFSAVMP